MRWRSERPAARFAMSASPWSGYPGYETARDRTAARSESISSSDFWNEDVRFLAGLATPIPDGSEITVVPPSAAGDSRRLTGDLQKGKLVIRDDYMTKPVPEIGAAEFKAKCLELIDEIHARKRNCVIITKRGKPYAKLIPVDSDQAPFYGCMKGLAENSR